jgi:hypothetical protein
MIMKRPIDLRGRWLVTLRIQRSQKLRVIFIIITLVCPHWFFFREWELFETADGLVDRTGLRTMVSPQPTTACCTRRARRRGNTPRGDSTDRTPLVGHRPFHGLNIAGYNLPRQCGLVGKCSWDGLMQFPKHRWARDSKFLVTHPMTFTDAA